MCKGTVAGGNLEKAHAARAQGEGERGIGDEIEWVGRTRSQWRAWWAK